MAEDLGIQKVGTKYELTAPVSDGATRVSNRFSILLLSTLKSTGRGSFIYSQLKSGSVKTNSDIVNLFALSSSEIVTTMREYAAEVYPIRASLTGFSTPSDRTLLLEYTLQTSQGTVQDNIEVET